MRANICDTLWEVSALVDKGAPFNLTMGNFLAFLEPQNIGIAVIEEPKLLCGISPSGKALDAYLGAVGEYLSRKAGIQPPGWVESPCRFLDDFHYPSKNPGLNRILLDETPAPFKRRMLVVSANAMEVA